MAKPTCMRWCFWLSLVVFLLPPLVLASDYSLAPGDKLDIVVFNEPDMGATNLRVDGKGRVSLPLIGQIQVAGMTSEALEAELESRLRDGYLKNPVVTVSISEYRPFYVRGEVKSPGGYPYRDGLTVEIAVAIAGGFSERADEDKIKLVSKSSGSETSVGLQAPVNAGDIVIVEESFF